MCILTEVGQPKSFKCDGNDAKNLTLEEIVDTNFYRDFSYEYIFNNVLSDDLQKKLRSITPNPKRNNAEISIRNVPREVFSELFCKLSLADLSQVRSVCKQWHKIENGRSLTLIALVALGGKKKLKGFSPEVRFLMKYALPQSKRIAISLLKTPKSKPFTTLLFKINCLLSLREPEEPFREGFFKFMSAAASQGCEEAKFLEGTFYLDGSCVKKNIKKAFEIFQSAAINDTTGCINFLVSRFYKEYKRFDIPPNPILELEYLKVAAEKGLPDAECSLAEDYLNQGEEQEVLAVDYLHKAWAQGFMRAGSLLFYCYLNGKGVTKNLEKAKAFLIQVDKGNMPACTFSLAEQYQLGSNVLKNNVQEGITLFQKSAVEGYPPAFEKLCIFYALGTGVTRDHNKAEQYFKSLEEWLQKNACKEPSAAQFLISIAKCYEGGLGVDRDLDVAMGLYELSAEQGYIKANFYLGTFYEEGDVVPEDAEKMIYHYKLAADAGCTKAQFKMCQLYSQGFGEVAPNLGKATECFNTLMANQVSFGQPIALAYCYALGFGTEKNEEKSLAHFHVAADKQHYAAAQFKLCVHYASIGNNEKASAYFNLLSNELHRDEIYRIQERYHNISFCYRHGIGVRQNNEMAILYDQKAEAIQLRFFPGSYL